MRIVYPYNEILPNRKAHDVFLFSECVKLAEAGFEVHLLCGKGSNEKSSLLRHYEQAEGDNFHIHPLPILRKNNIFGLSWNFPFFFYTQKILKNLKPDWVILSVRKQGLFHLSKKIPNARYLYEVHELSYYPNQSKIPSEFKMEKEMLEKADLVTVTTGALKGILLSPPYSLKVPVEVVPVAARTFSFSPFFHHLPLVLTYIGQLYIGQGIELLLKAMCFVEDVLLQIVGGKSEDVTRLKLLAEKLGITNKVVFLGFMPPAALEGIVQKSHAFVAPFQNQSRMPFVAHTKLYEYAHTGKPFIAPNLPIVRESFTDKKEVLLFENDDEHSLASCILALKEKPLYDALQKEMQKLREAFSWEKRISRYRQLLM